MTTLRMRKPLAEYIHAYNHRLELNKWLNRRRHLEHQLISEHEEHRTLLGLDRRLLPVLTHYETDGSLAAARHRHRTDVRDLTDELRGRRLTCEEFERRTKRVETELQGAREELKRWQTLINDGKLPEEERAKRKLEKAEEALQQKEYRIEELHGVIEDMKRTHQVAYLKAKSSRDEVDSQVENLQEQVSDVKKALKEKEREIALHHLRSGSHHAVAPESLVKADHEWQMQTMTNESASSRDRAKLYESKRMADNMKARELRVRERQQRLQADQRRRQEAAVAAAHEREEKERREREEKERQEREQHFLEQREAEQREAECREQQRVLKERLERERMERMERERLERERIELERRERQRVERIRIEELENEKMELARQLEGEITERERIKGKLEKLEKMELERIELERLEKERIEREHREEMERERLEKKMLEHELLQKEKKERAEREKLRAQPKQKLVKKLVKRKKRKQPKKDHLLVMRDGEEVKETKVPVKKKKGKKKTSYSFSQEAMANLHQGLPAQGALHSAHACSNC